MKLITLADGFGDSIAVPPWYLDFYKWPEIINFMTRHTELTNLSRYGAGNEFIMQSLRQNLKGKDVALVQWAMPNRLDLVLPPNNDFWEQQIKQDSMYKDNIVEINTKSVIEIGNDRYWISSASQNIHVQEYHQKFINIRQHRLRSQMFIEHATLLLERVGVEFGFLLTYDGDYIRDSVTDTNKWYWHEPFKGMNSFRRLSKFYELDFGLVQPISLIQFDFIKQFIMPRINLNWRSPREIDAVENMLHRKYKEALKLKPNDSYSQSHS